MNKMSRVQKYDFDKNLHQYHPIKHKSHRTMIYVLLAIIVTAIVCQSSITFGIMRQINNLLGYYTLGLIILITMIFTNHADNSVGRILYFFGRPLFKFVNKHNPLRDTSWATPAFSVLLIIGVQWLISNLF